MPKKSPELTEKQRGGVFLASGSAHPELAKEIARRMRVPLDDTELRTFANSELYVRFGGGLRGKHAVLIQSHVQTPGRSVNDATQELILMAEAARKSSARRVTAVIPHLAYGRQDRQTRGHEPVSASVALRQLAAVGVGTIVSLDMHSQQSQEAFDNPYDHLSARPLIFKALKRIVKARGGEFAVIAPDIGRAKTDEQYAYDLGASFDMLLKKRSRDDPSEIVRPNKPKNVRGKNCIIIDDIIDTAGTLVTAAESLHDAGATRIIAAATHGLFSGPALERLEKAPIDQLIVTDTVPQGVAQEALGDRLKVLHVAPLLAAAVYEIVTDGSVSGLFSNYEQYT